MSNNQNRQTNRYKVPKMEFCLLRYVGMNDPLEQRLTKPQGRKCLISGRRGGSVTIHTNLSTTASIGAENSRGLLLLMAVLQCEHMNPIELHT